MYQVLKSSSSAESLPEKDIHSLLKLSIVSFNVHFVHKYRLRYLSSESLPKKKKPLRRAMMGSHTTIEGLAIPRILYCTCFEKGKHDLVKVSTCTVKSFLCPCQENIVIILKVGRSKVPGHPQEM
jgi:hypothetical protein